MTETLTTEALAEALEKYDRAVEWHYCRPHDVGRKEDLHHAAAVLAETARRVTPQAVALVIAVNEEGGEQYAIFENEISATAWADSRAEPCVIVYPMVIGEPEFGNVVKS